MEEKKPTVITDREIDKQVKELFSELLRSAKDLTKKDKDVFSMKLRLVDKWRQIRRDRKNQENTSVLKLTEEFNEALKDPKFRKAIQPHWTES